MTALRCFRLLFAAAAVVLSVASAAQEPGASATDATAAESLVRVDAVRLQSISVEGSSVFTAAELGELTAPYENRPVSFEDLQALRHELSRRYVERGYVTSGVVIPDQQVGAGHVTLHAIEGGPAQIVVEGNRRLRDRPITRRVARHLRVPLKIDDVQAGLRELQNDPLVERVSAQLQPGDALGESYLRIGVTERRPLEIAVIAANDRAAAVGEDRGTFGVTYRGLIGNGDVITGRFGFSEGAEDNSIAYRVPLTLRGTTLEVAAAEQDADIVEEPFDDIDITSRLKSWSLTATRPFISRENHALSGFASFEHKRTRSTLLGVPFSFSAGDVDGEATGSAVALGVEWSRRGAGNVLAVRGSALVGVDVLDPSLSADGPDSEFTAYLAQVQYGRDVRWRGSRLLVRAALQIADRPLLAMYKLPVGGAYSVRGFRESQLVRDNGFAASIEYRFPALLDASGQPRGKLELAAFADYGLSVDEEPLPFADRREHLSSIGFGLLWNPLPALHAQIYRGVDLTDRDNPRESLQDRGIHYSLAFRRAF